MIEIKNDAGLALHLATGQAITVEQASGWLASTDLPGSFSYPISAPLNESNERFLQYGYRPNAAKPVMEISVNVRLEGVMYRRCLFSYRVNSGKIDGYLKIDAGEVWPSLRDKQLGDILPDYLPIKDGLLTGLSFKARLKEIAQYAPGTYPFTFFPIKNDLQLEDEFTSDKLPGFVRTGYLNNWDRFDFLVDTGIVFGNLISPQFYLWWVFEQIMTAAGYRLAGDFFADPEVMRLTIFNLTAMKQEQGFNAVAGNLVFPKQHLPDMSVADLLKAIKNRYGLIYSFNANDKICTVRRYADVWKSRRVIQDWREFQTSAYGIEEPASTGYTIEEYLDPSDELYKIPDSTGNLQPGIPKTFVMGKGGEKISLQVGTTNITYIVSPYSQTTRWMVPIVRQPGNILDPAYQTSDRYATDGQRKNTVGLRLLSYRGMVPDSAGSLYPLGTPDIRNGRQEVISSVATSLSGRYGGWNTGLRLYYHFLTNTRKVTLNLLLPPQRLSTLDLHEPIMLQFEGQAGSYLPGKVQAEAPGTSGKLRTHLEAQTIPSGLDLPDELYPDPIWVEWIQTITPYENIRINNVDGVQKRSTITVKFWKERTKINPVSAQSLLLNVRKKLTFGNNTGTNYETIIPYRGNGTSTILENNIPIERILITTGGATPENYGIVFNLEPSDEYNLI